VDYGWALSVEDADAFMLGEESIKTTDPELRRFHAWRVAKGGVPHPAICHTCGRVLRRELWSREFRPKRRKLDLAITYDGYYIASERAREALTGLRVHGACFEALPAAPRFYWLDVACLPSLEVDVDTSRVRMSESCPTCTE
jgi:hypothetical protein